MHKTQLSPDAYYLDGLFDETECHEYIRLSEDLGYEPAAIDLDGVQTVVKEIRNNERVIHDNPGLSQALFQRLREYLPESLDGHRITGLNERLRFYRYDPGQVFRWHRDGSFKRTGEQSRLSLVIYLNQDFEGGATEFREFSVTPRTGRAVVFKHALLHEGAGLKRGRKYVMRTDVMYARSQ